ncbi:hypothetical protein FEM33_22785 [Dyadobacter flavalbus]|uniref:Uncharacterized protein n=1 Tax=Dyadobacter flavalbus TaxID=2579942 RepID=A0A5M8QDM6_9BACT|nr:hypothetical protein FEM33_22785 [Dyadobacter flavalbus]
MLRKLHAPEQEWETRIYNAVFIILSEPPALVCHTPLNLTDPAYTVTAAPAHTAWMPRESCHFVAVERQSSGAIGRNG